MGPKVTSRKNMGAFWLRRDKEEKLKVKREK